MKGQRSILSITVGVVLLFLFGRFGKADVIIVDDNGPTDCNTIQTAIDISGPQDIILVADGIYTGEGNWDISFRGKAITVISVNGPEHCIIDGGGSHRGFIFASGEGRDSILDGFTIQNGFHFEGWEQNGYGGGIYINNSSPVIQNCILKENRVYGSSVECMGHAIGGGICIFGECMPLITHTIFLRNEAELNCISLMSWKVDGLYASSDAYPEVRNCTFIEDDMYLYWGDAGEAVNLLFYQGIVYATNIRYSVFPGADGTNGNVSAIPIFADPAHDDYHLKSESGRWKPGTWIDPNTPADPNDDQWIEGQWVYDTVTSPGIDAGDPADASWQKELWPHGKRINVGAYGGTPQASMSPNPVGILSDLDHDDLVRLGDLALFCEDWLLDLPLLDTDLDRDNDVDGTDFAILSTGWRTCLPANLNLSQHEFTFLSIEPGINPEQILSIQNLGTGQIHWQVESEIEIPAWLNIEPLSGQIGLHGCQSVTLVVEPNTLSAGIYTYSFQIADPNVLNSPQVVTITFIHSYRYSSFGQIIGWGSNSDGESTPPAGNDYMAVAAGDDFSLALRSNGSLIGWGENYYQQATPPAGNDFVALAAGEDYGLALRSDGSIVGWGRNNYGQITPPAGNDFVALAAGEVHNLALRSDGTLVGWGDNYYHQATPPGGNDFVAIATGAGHSLALRSDGSIVGWGYNYSGQATPPAGNDFMAIAAGYYHSLALRSDGSIVGWGSNSDGQSTPPAGNDFVAIAAGYYHSLALRSDGNLVGWGKNNHGQATPPAGSDHVFMAAGETHSLAIRQIGFRISDH